MGAFNCYQLSTFSQYKNSSSFLSYKETPGEKLLQGSGAAQTTVFFLVSERVCERFGRAQSSPEKQRDPGVLSKHA